MNESSNDKGRYRAARAAKNKRKRAAFNAAAIQKDKDQKESLIL